MTIKIKYSVTSLQGKSKQIILHKIAEILRVYKEIWRLTSMNMSTGTLPMENIYFAGKVASSEVRKKHVKTQIAVILKDTPEKHSIS